ncbi:hypothetical protein D3C71_907870 [compost metagenome]
MSHKPTTKSLRAGQTVWYPHYAFASAQYEVRSMVVLSDKAPLPEPHLIADGFPRYHIRGALECGLHPAYLSYSRRKVMSWIKSRGGVTP